MDMLNAVHLKKEVNGRVYVFSMPSQAPIGEVYDVLVESLQDMVKLAQSNADRMAREEKKEENN